ncbi:MAG: NAD(P)/FAD-dependent oxidoreductase [Spirochaetales bacterium]|nr:NAD(P)/FAD-dependent oxidoreductase [Spirochaetales bacterium]
MDRKPNDTQKRDGIVYDVVIIGAGVTGTAIAHTLSRYEIRTAVVEKELDVSFGVSKANSGIIHGGFHHSADMLKARLELTGNAMFDDLKRELDFPFKRCGIIVVAFSVEELRTVEELYARGVGNAVPGIELCGRERIHELEPKLNPDIVGGLYAPTGGIIEPYRFAFALKESAELNGVDFFTGFELTGGRQEEGGIWVLTGKNGSSLRCRRMVNAAGLFADEVSRILGGEIFTIRPRKGEEYLLDRMAACHPSRVVFPVPGKVSKGMLVIPTVEGTTMAGPTAKEVGDKEDTATSEDNFHHIFSSARRIVPSISEYDVITSFAGLRPTMEGNDFYIALSNINPHLVQVAGIQSPGLTASPAIAGYVKELIKHSGLVLTEKSRVAASPGHLKPLRDMNDKEAAEAIARDPSYGEIVCRCEKVSEAEIIDAIRKGHTTLDGIKFYTRAGMGRCQGGFCSYKIMKLLTREGIRNSGSQLKGSAAGYVTGRLPAVNKGGGK